MTAMNRRDAVQSLAGGLGSVALTAMLSREGFASDLTPAVAGSLPTIAPRAKNVIWLFMVGGASHMESFDPKPALNQYAGKTIEETPHAAVLKSPYLANERVVAPDANGLVRTTIYPLQIGYRPWGESGLEISDWWPHLGTCADDLCLVRSMWTEDSNHGAQLQFLSGKHRLDGFHPTIGSWASYGLGSLNQNLPEFVVLGTPLADCCGGQEGHRASYLGPQYDGVRLNVNPQDPLPYAARAPGVTEATQRRQFALLRGLNRMTADAYPEDPAIAARVQAYELAFRMQSAVPEVVAYHGETATTQSAYGLDQPVTKPFGEQLLVARRLVERGVRFVQVFHASNGGAGGWDAHGGLKANHEQNSLQVDQPIAALLNDLKQRGLLDETLVVWATEFGRTPGSQGSDGRDHHPYGFSVWLAGGGIKGGIAHGKTDELGFHAVEDRHFVTDIHATVLHQLGLNHRQLYLPNRVRLERDFGHVITPILA
jgi:hypothetical protein